MSESTTTSGQHGRTTILLTCVDPRIDPLVNFAPLGLGRPFVMRNPGGRVTPTALRDIAIQHYIVSSISGGAAGLGLVIVHHTDCRAARLGNPEATRILSEVYGVDGIEAAALGFDDPAASVREDIALLRTSLKLPSPLLISGHVFDVESGQLTQVVDSDAV